MKVKKIAILLMIFFSIFIIYSNKVQAAETQTQPTSIWETGKSWLGIGKNQNNPNVRTVGNEDMINEISGFLFGAGIVVAVVITAILGISFITASSSDQKAEVKKKAIIAFIGMIVLFSSVTIWSFLVKGLSSVS